MNLLIALALALAPRRAHADGPPAKGLRAFEGEPGDKKFVDASSSRATYVKEALVGGLGDRALTDALGNHAEETRVVARCVNTVADLLRFGAGPVSNS